MVNRIHFMKSKGYRLLVFSLLWIASCVPASSYYFDSTMDFAAVKRVAIMPFSNLSTDKMAAHRVRDVLVNRLMASGAVYVLPSGETARGIDRVAMINPSAPSNDEIAKFGALIDVDAVITGAVREYGEVRSGGAYGNVISFSLQMIEIQKQKIIWTASTTKGGINIWDRLFGGGGRPMNDITEKAVNDVVAKLLY